MHDEIASTSLVCDARSRRVLGCHNLELRAPSIMGTSYNLSAVYRGETTLTWPRPALVAAGSRSVMRTERGRYRVIRMD